MTPRTFDGTPPPARRATDRYLALGFTGAALLCLVVVYRALRRGDWAAALEFAVPTVLILHAAIGLIVVIARYRRAQRRAELRNHDNDG